MKVHFVLASMAFLTACSDSDVPSESPYKGQTAETFSLQLKQHRTIDGEKRLHWFQEYVSGYQEPSPAHVPASLTKLKAASSCSVPKPQGNARLVQVITWNSQIYAPLYAIDARKFDRIVENFMAVVSVQRNPGLALNKREGNMQPVDVAVTDTSGPIHLVLASRGPVLWNLAVAKDARITGITIVSSSETVAIANAPEQVKIHALVGEVAEKCGAKPALMPVKDYPDIKMQLHRANNNDEKFAELLAKYKTYNNFFRRQFGVDSDGVSIGVSVMNHAAVGPVPADPEARIAFRTLENSAIAVTNASFVLYGSDTEYVAGKKAAIIKAASKVAGRDYQSVLDQAGF